MKKNIFLMLATFIVASTFAQSGYKHFKTFHIASGGGWDYIFVNSQSNKLYVSHATQVNILDKNTGDSLGVIPNTTGVHGIAVINSLNKGYTSNGKINSVTVFELSSNKILSQISTGQNPDAIFYEPFSKTIITCNGRSKDLSVIDPTTDKVVTTIPVDGKPETAVSDNAGKVFVNIEDKNEIVVVDIKKNEVIARWSLGDAEGPSGLVIDTHTKRLFSTCEKNLVVMNAVNGKIVDKLPIGSRTDGAAFNPVAKLVFTSNGEGTITVVKEINANKFKVIDNIITKKGAKTICIDESSHNLYLPTADFEPQAAGEKGKPKIIAGSFQIIVFNKQ